jgi:hypothetical protein
LFLFQRLFPPLREFFKGLEIPQWLDAQIARIKVPQSTVGRMAFCFASELLSFFIIATNFRALAKGMILWTVITDGLIVLQNTIIGKIYIEHERMRDGASTLAFTAGGMCGSALSILLTRFIWGS